MLGYVEVQNLPSTVLNHKEAIEKLESCCGYGEEVESSDYLTMISKECQLLLTRISGPWNAAQETADA